MTALQTEVAAVTPARVPDVDSTLEAALDAFDALGVDTGAPGVADAAAGFVRLYGRLLAPEPFEPTTFENDGGYDELIVVRDIPFVSLCACHIVPYRGSAHVGYRPSRRILGLSKLARLVDHEACAVQTPERLAQRVADWLEANLAPDGAGVVVESKVACDAFGSEVGRHVTSVLRGRLRNHPESRGEFLDLCRTTSGGCP